MTTDELLKPRYKCIAGWPHMELENISVGDVLYLKNAGNSEDVWNSMLSIFPHLFRKLEWWEERLPEDMPQYVKRRHTSRGANQSWIIEKIDGQFFVFEEWAQKGFMELLPATEQEYLTMEENKI